MGNGEAEAAAVSSMENKEAETAAVPFWENGEAETAAVPSLDTGMTNTLAPPIRLTEEPEKASSPRETEEDEPITGVLMAGQIEPAEPKKAPKPVRISGDRGRIIRRVIDGQEYFLVPVEEAMLE